MQKPLIIAEVKTKSPFGFVSDKSWDELFYIASKYGDIISIHTDERWGGSFDLIEKARKLTSKAILAKGIHATDGEVAEAISRGADYVLVVGRIPDMHLNKCLIEPNTIEELKNLPNNLKAVWNARDLSNGQLKKETFKEARKSFSGWLCQASHIKSYDDVDLSADAILVGENLLNFVKTLRN